MSDVKPKTCTNAVVYDSMGNIAGLGRQTVQNLGFSVNKFVVTKKGSKLDQHKIVNIGDDGSVDMVAVGISGKLSEATTTIQMDEFISNYKEFQGIEYLKDYPTVDMQFNKNFEDMFYKGIVVAGIKELMRRHTVPDCRIMLKPVRGVYANLDFDEGDYIIIPSTCKITIERKASEPCGTTSVIAKFSILCAPRAFLNAEAPSDKGAAQFWCVESNDDKEKCNCEFSEKVLKIKSPEIDGCKKKAETIDVNIPIIHNFKKISKDNEIIVYKAAVKKAAKSKIEQKPVLKEVSSKESHASKRQKIS